jgi:peptidyl-tRNA hydrolase
LKEADGQTFLRIAVGIGRPESREPEDVAAYVLSDVPVDDLEIILHQSFPKILRMLENEVDLYQSNT